MRKMHAGYRNGTFITRLALALAAGCFVSAIHAAEAAPYEVVIKGLKKPSGVAIRPGGSAARYEVFVAESGAGQIVKWSNVDPDKHATVVTGFKATQGSSPSEVAGVAAVAFLDPGLLVVGTMSDAEGDLIRTFELTDDEKPLNARTALGDEESTSKFPGATCVAITRSRANGFVPDMLVLAVRESNGENRLLRARVQAGIVGSPRGFGKGEIEATLRAVATSGAGRIVVADTNGQLAFYNPMEGTVELTMDTGLKNLTALAVNSATGNLYAADFDGGIYRIDDVSKPGQPACKAVQVAAAARPTNIAFAPDGFLYVTTFGAGDADGALGVLSGDF